MYIYNHLKWYKNNLEIPKAYQKRKSKKGMQYNGQLKNGQKANNDLHRKLKIEQHESH